MSKWLHWPAVVLLHIVVLIAAIPDKAVAGMIITPTELAFVFSIEGSAVTDDYGKENFFIVGHLWNGNLFLDDIPLKLHPFREIIFYGTQFVWGENWGREEGMRTVSLEKLNPWLRINGFEKFHTKVTDDRWSPSMVSYIELSEWLISRLSSYRQFMNVRNIEIGALGELERFPSKVIGMFSSIGRFSVLKALPRSYYNQAEGKGSQQGVGKFDLPPQQYRVFGGFIQACLAVVIGFFVLIYGFGRWDDGRRLLGVLGLLVGISFAFYGTIGFLLGWNVWALIFL
ncbi:MAG: hypothetical protein H0X01_01100 [Nitrospira sp.]|nr:hypothetical protein [Nitrospira sp.]